MVTPTRQLEIPAHLWEAFERMAEAMGSAPEALAQQALRLFAHQNGFLGAPPASPAPPAAPSVPPSSEPATPPASGEARRAVAEQVLEAADRLEQAIRDDAPTPRPAADARLYLVSEGGELGQVSKARFVIGRGKHCDLVIDSPKISREHAAIVREGDAWYMEDLGSSNGTWFDRGRIERRRIADGDDYFICSEKIRCVIR
jgi:hypothetical protein